MIFDPISDMLTRIRNASAVKKNEVVLPFSKIKMQIAEILVREGYLKSIEKLTGKLPSFRLNLRYEDGSPVINEINRVSKPGRRVYWGVENLRERVRGVGIKIISTSRGLMTDKEAKKQKVGGEIICEVN